MSDSLLNISNKVCPILKRFKVKRAGVFGSYARGQQTSVSDVDLLVDAPENLSIYDLVGLQQELEETLGRRVDLVEYDLLKPRIRKRALTDEVRIL
jgi:uncharacterized protein